MTTYRITAPNFVATIIRDGDTIVQSAPILGWAVGKDWTHVRNHLKNKGYTIEPLIEVNRIDTLEYNGNTYEFHWADDHIQRITVYLDDEPIDITWEQVPDVLKEQI
jgi:hypothetical protein